MIMTMAMYGYARTVQYKIDSSIVGIYAVVSSSIIAYINSKTGWRVSHYLE